MKYAILVIFLVLSNHYNYAQKNYSSLLAQLDTINNDDQLYRKIKNASPADDTLNMGKQRRLDLINLARIEKIIAQYGYPGKSMVGEQHQSVVFMVIQHNDQEIQEKYLSLLTEAAAKGELRQTSLAILIDRVRTGRGETQLYGSQLHETKDGIKIYPIEDEPNVNIRRKQIGLVPLEQYLAQWKIDYHVPTSSQPNAGSMYYFTDKQEPIAVEAIGGDKGIFSRLTYPADAKAANISGSVIVEFTVDKNGRTKDISIAKSLGYGCDEEALKVISETTYINKTGQDRELRMKLPFPYEKK